MKGTIHWVSASHGVPAEIRLYDRLFSVENPLAGEDKDAWLGHINPSSLEVVRGFVEPSLADAATLARYQFERVGYFAVDPDSKPGALVFNRTISLKDSWTAQSQK